MEPHIQFNQNKETIDLGSQILDLCSESKSDMMDDFELACLASCISNFNWVKGTYLIEIGTNIGKTAVFMAKLLKILGKDIKIASIDPFELAHDEELNAKGSYSKYVKSIQKAKVDDICFPIVAYSDNAVGIFNENVGVLLIDGCHEYECARNDLENYSGLVCSGGYVFVDDYSLNYPGVKRAFDEWFEKQNDFELAHKESWFVVVKKK